MWWMEAKDATVAVFALSRDMLHLFGGLAIFAIVALALHRTRHALIHALVATTLLETLNEVMDQRIAWQLRGSLDLHESVGDMQTTLLLPGAITLAVATARMWWPPAPKLVPDRLATCS